MTVDEVLTKFSFKADTKKAESFGKATDKIKESLKKTDAVWGKINSKLAAGFQSKWFDQFSKKITDLRRVQLFFGGIRRGIEFITKAIPGLKGVGDFVIGLTKKYNSFTTQLIHARSAMRSFGLIFSKTLQGMIPAIKATIAGLFNGVKAMFNQVHTFLLNSNNAFLNGLGKGFSRFQDTISRIKGIRNLGAKIQSMTANIPGLGKLTAAFSAFGLGAAAAIGLVVAGIIVLVKSIGALVAKVKKSTQDFIAFETGMKGVQRVTLATAGDMGRLEEAALKAGEASVFGAKDAADAERFLAMAGLSVNEVIGALPGTLQLAAAGEMDLATAADIATNIMSANALEVKDLARMNDILAYSASNSNQNVMQLGSALQTIGPAGRLAALSVEDMSSWLAVLANNGLKGQMAGTMVRNAIKDLVTPTDKMSKALAKGGISLSDFVDATGKISNINDLMKALQGMDEVSRGGFLAALDERTYRALAPIISGDAEKMAEFNAELKNAGGTAEKMASLAFEGLSGSIKEYKSKMETANISFMKDSGLNVLFEEIVRFGSAILPELWKSVGLALKPFVKILIVALKVLRSIAEFTGGVLKIFNNLIRIALSFLDKGLAPILDAVDQISYGIKKAFSLLSDLGEGPLKWVAQLFGMITDSLAAALKFVFSLVGPLLFVIDLLLNLFLIILPNAVSGFFDKIEEWYQNSFLGKIGEKMGELSASIITPRDNAGTGFSGFGGGGMNPAVVTEGSTKSFNVGKIETKIVVEGGVTNADTAEAVASAVKETMSSELRAMMLEVE